MEIESERVSVLLREIFAEEEAVLPTVAESTGPVQKRALDLDDAHSQFVFSLFRRDDWTRAELETIAAKYSILLDGALDTINESSLNLHGEPLLEGEDPMEVNAHVRRVIQL